MHAGLDAGHLGEHSLDLLFGRCQQGTLDVIQILGWVGYIWSGTARRCSPYIFNVHLYRVTVVVSRRFVFLTAGLLGAL